MTDEQRTPQTTDSEKAAALMTAFRLAATGGNTAILKELLDAGVDNSACFQGLMDASKQGQSESVKFLLMKLDNLSGAQRALQEVTEDRFWVGDDNRIKTVRVILDWIDQRNSTVSPQPPQMKT